jgi:hypothetical protein
MGMGTACNKLREVVEAALRQPVELQAQVADAWHSILLELLPPTR